MAPRAESLEQLAREKERDRADLIDLTESNPTRCGFHAIGPAELRLLGDGAAAFYQPMARGHLETREAIAAYYQRRGVTISPEQIILTASTSEAYSYLFYLLCEPGQKVLVPAPSYPLLDYIATLHDIELTKYRLCYNNGWEIDDEYPADEERKCSAVIAVSPNNPAGNLWRESANSKLLVDRALICDEVFLDYCFSSDVTFPTALRHTHSLRFVLSGLSKILGLPQLKLSWIVVAGPSHLRDEALRRLEVIADTFLSVNTPVQLAAPLLLSHAERAQFEIRHRLTVNRQALQTACDRSSHVELLAADGGWYALLRLMFPLDDESLCLSLLQYEEVVVHPGYFFDIEEDSVLVLSLLPPAARFSEGVSRIVDFIDRIAVAKATHPSY